MDNGISDADIGGPEVVAAAVPIEGIAGGGALRSGFAVVDCGGDIADLYFYHSAFAPVAIVVLATTGDVQFNLRCQGCGKG